MNFWTFYKIYLYQFILQFVVDIEKLGRMCMIGVYILYDISVISPSYSSLPFRRSARLHIIAFSAKMQIAAREKRPTPHANAEIHTEILLRACGVLHAREPPPSIALARQRTRVSLFMDINWEHAHARRYKPGVRQRMWSKCNVWKYTLQPPRTPAHTTHAADCIYYCARRQMVSVVSNPHYWIVGYLVWITPVVPQCKEWETDEADKIDVHESTHTSALCWRCRRVSYRSAHETRFDSCHRV